jgi:tRNA(adenine34) deaminase
MPRPPEPATEEDIAFMRLALRQAEQAGAAGEVPVGAVVVKDGVVIGAGFNNPLQAHDPTAHAEINALRQAAQALGNYRLEGCTLYVTLEPCAMCSGAMLHARLQRVVFGAAEPKTGCAGSVLDLFGQIQLNHHTRLAGGVLAAQAALQLQHFFQLRRSQHRELASPLRDDALRTPAHCFAALADGPWAGHYVSTLPSLAGLRMHYLDEGPVQAQPVLVCLHPIPGWSYLWRDWIAARLRQGARVLAPDLIGFGRSDKPKREDAHTLEWHARCLKELLQSLALGPVVLVLAEPSHPLAERLLRQAPQLVQEILRVPLDLSGTQARGALQAPYPDRGHRAGERAFSAFASKALQQAKIPP